jgi:hypothetical protein
MHCGDGGADLPTPTMIANGGKFIVLMEVFGKI